MTPRPSLRAIPTDDRAWLLCGLADALAGGAPVLPVAPDADPAEIHRLQQLELPAQTALVVRTSGSSGVPKAVALSAAALRESALATHDTLGGPGQWLVALPTHLISGLQMLVRSAVSGIAPEFFDGPFDPAALLEAATRLSHERRYLSLVPVQLERLLRVAEEDAGAADELRSFHAILVGGQAVTLDQRQRAHDLGVVLRRSYGMTETAGGCVYDGVEIGDTLVRIRGGEVQLAGPHLALGYVGDPQLTAERFIADQGARWYRTGDAGHLLGGMLTVTGRLDRVFISGGVNVSLDEIERVASGELDGVAVVAVAVEDPEWGQRPVLVVEGAAHATHPLCDRLRDRLRQQLGAAAVPERVVGMAALPRLAGGKPDLRQLSELLAPPATR